MKLRRAPWSGAGEAGSRLRLLSLLLVASAMCLAMSPASAGSLQISPISLDIPPGQSAVAITLRNTGESTLHAQVRVFGWSQVAADDRLGVTTELVASPPITEIPPHQAQLVRLVRTNHERVEAERCFRLLIDEIPEEGPLATDAPAVGIRLRYSVPVFIHATSVAEAPSIDWSVRASAGGWMLRAANRGDSHVRLSAVRLSTGDGTEITIADGLLGYALAHSGREWPVPSDAHLRTGVPVTVTATANNAVLTTRARDDTAVLDARVPAAVPATTPR